MRNPLLWVAFLLLSTGGACLRPGADRADVPETFLVGVGERRILGATGEEVGFRAVTQDSRCPRDVTCVWAGEATARLWILHRGRDSVFVDATIPGGAAAADTAANRPVDALGYRITLLQLDPYPRATTRTDPNSYRATLRVERLVVGP